MSKQSIAFACLFVLVVSGFGTGVSARQKPKITPEEDLVIQEGDELRIGCSGRGKLKFVTEKYSAKVDRSEAIVSYNESSHTYEFVIPGAAAVDTGWYACAEEGVEIINNDQNIQHSSEEISWVYVYVNSTKIFSVQDNVDVLYAVSGSTVVIPCLPTSPDRIPVLTDWENLLPVDFTPKIGFILEKVDIDQGGQMSCCKSDSLYDPVESIYILNVYEPEPLTPPVINTELVHHVVRGQNVTLECTFTGLAMLDINLKWDAPARIPAERLSHEKQVIDQYSRTSIVVQDIIRNVTDSDQGVYTCTAQNLSSLTLSQSSMNLIISDPEYYFINYYLHGNEASKYDEGQTAVWRMGIDSYPASNITWFGNNGLPIPEYVIGTDVSRKYSHSVDLRDHWFRITHLKLRDSGVYVIRVTTEHESKDIRLNLTVVSKPVTEIVNSSSFHFPRKPTSFSCMTIGSPLPNVTWRYSEYPNLPSEGIHRLLHLSNNENRTHAVNEFTLVSRLNLTLNASGFLTCETCNELECTEATQQIYLSDVGHPFHIIPPNEVIVGDNITVICGSSVYNYSEKIEWKKGNATLFDIPGKLSVRWDKTNFTYLSILEIYNVTKSDRDMYACEARDRDNNSEFRYYDLHDVIGVPARRKPKITPKKVLVIQEGDELRIKCRGRDKIKFVTEIMPGNVIHQSDAIPSFNESSGTYEFIIPRAAAADTGWYACAEDDVEIINDHEIIEHSSEEISWLYIYVNSARPSSGMTDYQVRSTFSGNKLGIPRLPTTQTERWYLLKIFSPMSVSRQK